MKLVRVRQMDRPANDPTAAVAAVAGLREPRGSLYACMQAGIALRVVYERCSQVFQVATGKRSTVFEPLASCRPVVSWFMV